MDRFRVTPANSATQFAQQQQQSLDYGESDRLLLSGKSLMFVVTLDE